MAETHFDRALQNFMHDVANGGAIRHLADLGYTAEEIVSWLDFAMSVEAVGAEMWAHFLSNDTIRLSRDEKVPTYRVVKEQGKYGKTTFRRVATDDNGATAKPYLPCDFGIRLRADREAFCHELAVLTERDRDYILGLPWENVVVWHRPDERMKRIFRQLNDREGDRQK